MSCERWDHEDDAAYVLGALSPAERREFEQHLEGCESCARSVRELAGLPGLLSRLEAAEVEHLEPLEPVPPRTLQAVLKAARRERRRRLVWAAGGATAAAVALVAGTVAVTQQTDEPSSEVSGTPQGIEGTPMAAIDQDRLAAEVGLKEVAWGTKLVLRCRYLGTPESVASLPAYVLVLHTRDGGVERVATWKAIAGKEATIDAATATGAAQITGVDVQTVSGRTLLHLDR